jgi:hypothetical protein
MISEQCESSVTKVLEWKVQTACLLQEILKNNDTAILTIPLQIFASLLGDVATRAAELNDRQLNKLMLQLSLYSAADPTSPDYDRKVMEEYGL